MHRVIDRLGEWVIDWVIDGVRDPVIAICD
jgi:hypothetical protein